jgi:hypothetical protein
MKAKKQTRQELGLPEVGQKPRLVPLASSSAWARLEGDNTMVV